MWHTYLLTWGPFLLFYLAFTIPCLLALRARVLDVPRGRCGCS